MNIKTTTALFYIAFIFFSFAKNFAHAKTNSAYPITIVTENINNYGYIAFSSTISEILKTSFPDSEIRVVIAGR